MRFFASGFFHESFSPKNNIRAIFIKICGDIRKSRCTTAPVSMTPASNCATGNAGVVDNDSKFATGVNDTDCKFAAGVKENCRRHQRHRRRQQYQTADTVNLKEEIYLYVNSTTQKCPNKII